MLFGALEENTVCYVWIRKASSACRENLQDSSSPLLSRAFEFSCAALTPRDPGGDQGAVTVGTAGDRNVVQPSSLALVTQTEDRMGPVKGCPQRCCWM